MNYYIVLWYHGPRGRPFDTISDDFTHLPCAYSLNYLQEHHFKLFHAATQVHSAQELTEWTSSRLFPTVTRNSPLLVPVDIAESQLGWKHFHFVDAGQPL